ncbi:26S proteasome non-ATPase regulatory subunit 9 [Lonchura striata]|uniref:26S proteasome non-ATPase regulatory subunit 9 n=1 Tax=Lonchura striata TaxID=40157 RepID=A0A218V5I4_9PASE|nr:26S proteasome non-ATPase regulatory subunit 9 [Lonchura striata domestica]
MAEPGEGRPVTVSDVQQLVRRKDEVEAQIKACYELLEGQKGVGMHEPLVDAEGFPRSDIDLYQVRTARHNIICLQNDHKALMKQVEEALHKLHAREKEKHAKDEAEALAEAMSQKQSLPQAFAKVNTVTPGSPASVSGLQVDDEIVEFGSVNANNFQNLQNIATVVQHSEGLQYRSFTKMTVTGRTIKLKLVPVFWTLIWFENFLRGVAVTSGA